MLRTLRSKNSWVPGRRPEILAPPKLPPVRGHNTRKHAPNSCNHSSVILLWLALGQPSEAKVLHLQRVRRSPGCVQEMRVECAAKMRGWAPAPDKTSGARRTAPGKITCRRCPSVASGWLGRRHADAHICNSVTLPGRGARRWPPHCSQTARVEPLSTPATSDIPHQLAAATAKTECRHLPWGAHVLRLDVDEARLVQRRHVLLRAADSRGFDHVAEDGAFIRRELLCQIAMLRLCFLSTASRLALPGVVTCG